MIHVGGGEGGTDPLQSHMNCMNCGNVEDERILLNRVEETRYTLTRNVGCNNKGHRFPARIFRIFGSERVKALKP